MKKKATALFLTLVLVLALLPNAALASLFSNTWETAIPLAIGVPQAVSTNMGQYNNTADMKYHFTVTDSSLVTINLTTVNECPVEASYNRMSIVLHADDDNKTKLITADGGTLSWVNSGEGILSCTTLYKLLPGKYYVRAEHISAGNAYGIVTLKSVTAIENDVGGEPNDTIALASAKPAVQTGTVYRGNINYGCYKEEGTSRFYQDNYDYYRFVVPYDGYSVKLSATHANDGKQKIFSISLYDSSGWYMGSVLNMHNLFSADCEFKNLDKGTYYIKIDGLATYGGDPVLPALATEYTFRLDPITVPVASVTLPTTQKVDVGNTVKLTPAILPEDATNKKVTWTTSAAAVATVDANGVVTGKKAGSARITVTTEDGSKTAFCMVNVASPVTSLETARAKVYLEKGKSATLGAVAKTRDGTKANLNWESSNPAIVKVSSAGKLTAKKAGNATITIRAENGKETKIKVYVGGKAIKKLAVTNVKKLKKDIKIGNTMKLQVSPVPSDSRGVATFSSNNKKVLTVDAAGWVSALATGKAKVTVGYGAKKVYLNFTVK